MVSWAVTGATRGIGFGFIDNLSADPKNQVFALIRSRATASPLEALAAKRKNIHIIVTDISDPRKLDDAAAQVSKLTGGSLDSLILNAGSAVPETGFITPTGFRGKEEALDKEINENVKNNLICNIYVINCFLDLVRNGKEKKIIFISTQSCDVEFTRITGFAPVMGYSVAKAGMNIVMTKFGAELAPEGIKTLSLSPGWVDTDASRAITGDPETRKFALNAFRKFDPNVTGPISVDESVTCMLRVIGDLTEANSGKFLSHRGTAEQGF
ncbi:short-chain dehydrogenase [Fonsecaea pedrosoi]|nr:short-chain dehydrogenase [Fonsecaea pedrosoi]